ncbi:MAG TPA: phytanoyl-CoA dioxygenase family protein [Abditibacteriaceae bacterium]|nr:phytanoyl-CoA dioxygenase family protein [Abditibacteriaceae bacterium]
MATDTFHLAMRLIIDGCVVVPNVLVGDELKAMQDAFERRAGELGKRWMNWEDICLEPEIARYIAHPNLMAVVDAFTNHFGHEAVFSNSSGMRDAFNPEKPVPPFTPGDLRRGPLGWHDDVMGMRNPRASFLPTTLSALLYLDDTFADNGAYCTALGSHHLAYATPEDTPMMSPGEVVLDNCELKPLPVKAGSVVIHRAHSWHGVVPPRQRRRLVLQTFCARALYDSQEGHTQVSEETAALIPADRHRYLCHYAEKATAGAA